MDELTKTALENALAARDIAQTREALHVEAIIALADALHKTGDVWQLEPEIAVRVKTYADKLRAAAQEAKQ